MQVAAEESGEGALPCVGEKLLQDDAIDSQRVILGSLFAREWCEFVVCASVQVWKEKTKYKELVDIYPIRGKRCMYRTLPSLSLCTHKYM